MIVTKLLTMICQKLYIVIRTTIRDGMACGICVLFIMKRPVRNQCPYPTLFLVKRKSVDCWKQHKLLAFVWSWYTIQTSLFYYFSPHSPAPILHSHLPAPSVYWPCQGSVVMPWLGEIQSCEVRACLFNNTHGLIIIGVTIPEDSKTHKGAKCGVVSPFKISSSSWKSGYPFNTNSWNTNVCFDDVFFIS
jgi:hypothetical protein